MGKQIYFFQNITVHYRKKLWEVLLRSKEIQIHFFAGGDKYLKIKPLDLKEEPFSQYLERFHKVRNLWLGKKYLIWQKGVLSTIFSLRKPATVILLGEFLVLSNWLAAIICRLRRIRVVFWGHGLYGNEGRTKKILRKMFYRLADDHLVYGNYSKQLMKNEGFNPDRIHIIFNSLDYDWHKSFRDKYSSLSKLETFSFFKDPDLPTLLFIGRLTKIKRLDLLLTAVAELNREGNYANLLIIGDGSEREALEAIAADSLPEGSVCFYGSCYDEMEIGKLLSLSEICVSPGNVGLTGIHSLSFGTPVCTHSNFSRQMPEVEALIDGKTGVLFEENNPEDLKNKLKDWLFKNKRDRNLIREQCFEVIDSHYNPYYQKKVLLNLLEGNKPFI